MSPNVPAEVNIKGGGTHEIRRCGSNAVHTVDHPILGIEDLFECLSCRMRHVRVVFQREKDRYIPRASFCINSVVDSHGFTAVTTSQSVASADPLDTT